MIALVVVSLSTIFSPNPKLENLHTATWIIFLIDVAVRFIKATAKWKYVKGNPFDILSIIPLEDMFLLGRFARLFRLFRYKNVIKRYLDRINKLLDHIDFFKITVIVMIFNIVFALIFSLFTQYDLFSSFRFTFLNFFKFNHQSENTDYVFLSIVLKIIGVLYMGILLNKLLNFLRKNYEKFKNKKTENKTDEH